MPSAQKERMPDTTDRDANEPLRPTPPAPPQTPLRSHNSIAMAFQEELVNEIYGPGDFYMNPSPNDFRRNGQIDEEDSSSCASEHGPSFQETQSPTYPQHCQQQQQQQPLEPSPLSNRTVCSRPPTRPRRLAIPRSTFHRNSPTEWPLPRFQPHTANRLEVENTYLQSQNRALNKDIQYCRDTVQALKHILAQREETIERMKEDCRKAYMKSKFLESVLAEHHSLWQKNSVDGVMGQEEHRLDMLLRELREDELLDDDDDDEEEGVVDEAEEEDFGQIRRTMINHQPFSDDDEEDEEREREQEEEDLSDSDYGESSAPMALGHRFRELDLERLSPEIFASQVPPSSQGSVHTDSSSKQLPSDLFQQYSASFPPINTNGPNALVNPPPVLRRRPPLQINSRFQEVTPLHMSLSFSGPGSYRAMSFNSSDLSLSSRSSEESGSMTDGEGRADDSMEEETVKRDDEGSLRDSGHFPAEIFSSDTVVALGDDTNATEQLQLQLPAVASKPSIAGQAIEAGSLLAAKSDRVVCQCDSEGCLEEDRSESSVATVVSPAAEASEQAGAVDTSAATAGTAHGDPTPKTAGPVFSAGITGAAIEDKTGHSESHQDAASQKAESVIFMLPQEATTSEAAMSAPASKESTESLAESGGLRSTTSFLMRMFSGLGKQTAGVFNGRQPQDGVRQQQEKQGGRDADTKGGYVADRSASPSLRDPVRKNALRVTGKGIGFRRLAHRRSRTMLTSPVSVVVTGGVARADKAPSYPSLR